MYKMCWILGLLVCLSCESVEEDSNKSSVKSVALKLEELLFYDDLSLLKSEAEKGNIKFSSIMLDEGLTNKYNKVKANRSKLKATDKLRESNVTDYIKSHMKDPFSFILHDISFRSDNALNSEFGYRIANVEYFGNNSYGARVREKAKLRITPHGFVMQRIRQ